MQMNHPKKEYLVKLHMRTSFPLLYLFTVCCKIGGEFLEDANLISKLNKTECASNVCTNLVENDQKCNTPI